MATITNFLPYTINKRLFGDRKRFGKIVNPEDPDWKEWEEVAIKFYTDNQTGGVGVVVNRAGYQVMSDLDMSGKTVLEIGPGYLPHRPFWKTTPSKYILADIRQNMLDTSAKVLSETKVPHETLLLPMESSSSIPLEDNSVDLIVSFYALEHLHPIDDYLVEYKRVLKTGGRVVGAIPCEGGLGWGLGRFLTTRRWLKKNSGIDPDKIICWEHPNFAQDVISALDRHFERKQTDYWPFKVPVIDSNLLFKFEYQKTR